MPVNNGRSVCILLTRQVLCLAIVMAATPAGAQQADSLSGFLKEAATKNPGLKAKHSLYLAALEKVPQAGSLPDPEVQFSFFITPMALVQGSQIADFRVMQMSPWFGTLNAARDEASKMALARYEEMANYRNELFMQVKSSWYQVYRTKKEIEVSNKNLALLHSLERMALVRFKASGRPVSSGPEQIEGGMPDSQEKAMGAGTQGGMIDLLRIQIEIGSLENRLAMLNDELKSRTIRFNINLAREPLTEVFVCDSLMEAPAPDSLTLLADRIANNPMIRMYEAEKEANEARISMVTRMGYPMVGAGLNYSLIQKRPDAVSTMNGQDMVMPMLSATLPVYRKKYNAMRREAEFLRDAAGESATNIRNELSANYQENIQEYNDADRRLDLYKHQASLAEKTVSLLTRSFSVAGTDFEEILRMHQQLLDFEFKQIEALVDRNMAIAKLLSIISSY